MINGAWFCTLKNIVTGNSNPHLDKSPPPAPIQSITNFGTLALVELFFLGRGSWFSQTRPSSGSLMTHGANMDFFPLMRLACWPLSCSCQQRWEPWPLPWLVPPASPDQMILETCRLAILFPSYFLLLVSGTVFQGTMIGLVINMDPHRDDKSS